MSRLQTLLASDLPSEHSQPLVISHFFNWREIPPGNVKFCTLFPGSILFFPFITFLNNENVNENVQWKSVMFMFNEKIYFYTEMANAFPKRLRDM